MRRQDSSKSSAAIEAPIEVGAADAVAEAKRAAPREGFVLFCILIVSVALTTMLFSQFGFTFSAAAITGACAWATFMLIHKQVQKSAQINQLKAELARTRLRDMRARGGTPVRSATIAPASAPSLDARPTANPAGQTPLPSRPATMSPLTAGGAGNKVAKPDGVRSEGVRPAGIVLRGSLPTPEIHGDERMAPPVVSDAPSMDLSGMHIPVLGGMPPSDAGKVEAGPGNTTPNRGEAVREQWAFRPRSEAGASLQSGMSSKNTDLNLGGARSPGATVEGDLELVQRKIREMAQEVNAGTVNRPVKPMPTDGRGNSTTDAIEHSIDALKAAASNMRQRNVPPDFIPTLTLPSKGKARAENAPETTRPSEPSLGEFVIPETAERIAGSDMGGPPDSSDFSTPQYDAPDMPELPGLDFSRPPSAEASSRIADMANAIETDAVDVYLAPIVTLVEHSVSHYDMRVALQTGEGQSANPGDAEFARVDGELQTRFDIARLRRAAELSSRMEAREKGGLLLADVLGASFASRAFLTAIAEIYEARPSISTQLVLTLSQRSVDAFTPSTMQAVRDMHTFGFRFALDAIEHMGTDFGALAAAGFQFVRLEPVALLKGIATAERFVPGGEIYQRMTLAGLTVIAASISDAKTQKLLLDAGIGLGQGPLFGAERQVMLDGPGSARRSAAA